MTAIRPILLTSCLVVLGAVSSAHADTKVHQAAQVQFDVRDDWKLDRAGDNLVLTDPGSNLILVVEVLEPSALDQALKQVDTLTRKYIERVRWKKKPVSRSLNSMKAVSFEGTGVIKGDKGDKVDVGALIVVTPSSKPMLVFGFMASAQAATLRPQVDAFVESIRPARPEPTRPEPARPPPQREPARTEPPPAATRGVPSPTGFTVIYLPPSSPRFQRTLAIARKAGLEPFVDVLNQLVAMPRLIPIAIAECGDATAAYSPVEHQVKVCYEFIDLVLGMMSGDSAEASAAGVVKFTLMHELAHALSQELDLPIAGKEEDAADEFAAVLLSLEGGPGFDAALSAAKFFAILGDKQVKAGTIAWYDEHSFDLERMYGIVCILYGADQTRFARLTRDLGFPQDRLAKCVNDYPRKRKTWGALLAMHKRT
jgi:hypothetical protein